MILTKDIKEDEYICIDVVIVDGILKSPRSGQIISIKLTEHLLSRISHLDFENLSLNIDVDGQVRAIGVDDTYGEDADGNRGVDVIEEESREIIIHNVKIILYDDSNEEEIEELAGEECLLELVQDKMNAEEDLELEV